MLLKVTGNDCGLATTNIINSKRNQTSFPKPLKLKEFAKFVAKTVAFKLFFSLDFLWSICGVLQKMDGVTVKVEPEQFMVLESSSIAADCVDGVSSNMGDVSMMNLSGNK